jgi:hypothetical protein
VHALGIHNLTAVVVVLIAGYVLPFATSLISKAHWSGATMGLVTTLLASVTGFFGEWASSPDIEHWDWRAGVGLALGAFLTALASRALVLRATPLDAKLLAIGSKTSAPPVAPAA